MARMMIGIVAFVAVAVLAPPTFAVDGHSAPQVSVFPTPRDPWRSWGVRSEAPRHFAAPRSTTRDGFDQRAQGPIWVPGQWVWDGATWVWWPGHWVQ